VKHASYEFSHYAVFSSLPPVLVFNLPISVSVHVAAYLVMFEGMIVLMPVE
jgi:hypothetical protein